ncbi:MAG: hypothetical protein ACPGPS_07070 [Rubripirellula sp.]|jgi:hypothetical protein
MSLRKLSHSKAAILEFGKSQKLDDLLMVDFRGPQRMLDQTFFSEYLLNERVRCDRRGPRFCLLIFESTASRNVEHQIDEIGRVLSKHLRITMSLEGLKTRSLALC